MAYVKVYNSSKGSNLTKEIQGSSNRWAPGFVNFVPAVAYHFWLNLHAAFTEPRARLLEEPCMIQEN